MDKQERTFERMTSKQFRQEFLNKSLKKGNDISDQPIRKYRNRVVKWEGIWRGKQVALVFHSQKECNRGLELIQLEKTGLIKDLDFQKSIVLIPKFRGERGVTYRADAYYFDNKLNVWVVEDTKSVATKKLSTYILKRKLVKYLYREIKFLEV